MKARERSFSYLLCVVALRTAQKLKTIMISHRLNNTLKASFVMKKIKPFRFQITALAAILFAGVGHAHAQQFDPAKVAGLRGGLVVQLGASDTRAAAKSGFRAVPGPMARGINIAFAAKRRCAC